MSETEFSDETLMAFADGNLDPDTAAGIAARRTADPVLDRRIHQYEVSAQLARKAFDQVVREPVPLRLLAATRPSGRRWELWGSARALTAMAASLALAVGLGAGYLAGEWGGGQRGTGQGSTDLAMLAGCDAAGLSGALETAATGERRGSGACAIVPVASYRTDGGQVCRAFQASSASPSGPAAVAGIACRDDRGAWRTRVAVDMAPAAGGAAGYRPAAGPGVGLAGLRAAIGLQAAPLSTAEEESLLRSDWGKSR